MSFGGDIKPLVQGDLVLIGSCLLQAFVSHHCGKPRRSNKKQTNKRKKQKKNTDYNPHKNPGIQCTWCTHSQPEKEMLSSDCESSSPSNSGSKPVLASPLLRGREIWRVDNGSRDTKPTLAEKWPNVGVIATYTTMSCSVGHTHLWYLHHTASLKMYIRIASQGEYLGGVC